ncbi:MAG: hypothetical protein ACRD7E_17505 [Bryobacteraceae bacterium]
MRAAVLLMLCVAATAQVNAPQVGLLLDREGGLRPVLGIAGNFVVGAPVHEGVLAAAFSGQTGLAKTETELLVLDASGAVTERLSAPEGTALFAFDANGMPAAALFPGVEELWRWNTEGVIERQIVSLQGEALALSAAKLLVRREEGLWLVGEAGESPAEPGAVALLEDGTVLAIQGDELLIPRTGGRISIPEVSAESVRVRQMGRGWLAVEYGTRLYAVCIAAGRESVHQMPGVAPWVAP